MMTVPKKSQLFFPPSNSLSFIYFFSLKVCTRAIIFGERFLLGLSSRIHRWMKMKHPRTMYVRPCRPSPAWSIATRFFLIVVKERTGLWMKNGALVAKGFSSFVHWSGDWLGKRHAISEIHCILLIGNNCKMYSTKMVFRAVLAAIPAKHVRYVLLLRTYIRIENGSECKA